MSDAFWAFGSVVQLGDGATPENFVSIAEVTELPFLKMSKDSIETTNHSSPSGFRERIPGMKDAGSVDIKANWLPNNATQDGSTGVLAAFEDDLNHNWKIIAPGGVATASFAGHVTDWQADLPMEEQGQLSFSIQLSGKPVVV